MDVICASYLNHTHEKALRIIYQDYNCSFAELRRKGSSLNNSSKKLETVGYRNI